MDISETLHQLFRRQAERTPDVLAVVDQNHVYTYRQLNRATDAMAGHFQHLGVHFDTPVGIFMETCAEYVLSYLAALKAGGAYLPLNPAYPGALLQKILQEAEPRVVVTKKAYRNRLDFDHNATSICTDGDPVWKKGNYDPDSVVDQRPDHLAFIAYSSGTTGEPKGIQNSHRGAVHSYMRRYQISDYQVGDRVACNIFFVWEILRPLLRGGTIYVIPDDIIYDPRLLIRFLEDRKISETLMTPSLLESVLNAVAAERMQTALSRLRVLWLNGEVVTQALRKRALAVLPRSTRLLNTYSIAECNDVASMDLRRMEETGSSEFCPVGWANEDLDVRLFNDRLEPVADQPGELLVGGPGLARGYLQKPDLTAERFIAINGRRYYRTGDRAQFSSNGRIEILGRCDSMVKIRGYSINLADVESALQQLAAVHSCAVVVDGKEGQDKRLVAYVVETGDADWSIDVQSGACPPLREALAKTLPAYSIPSVFVSLDAIPFNPITGKADRKALPEPPRRTMAAIDPPPLAPDAGDRERQAAMLAIWNQILGFPPGTLKSDDNFVDFGGQSLSAVELTVVIEAVFNQSLKVKEIYTHPTVDDLLAFMTGRQATTGDKRSISLAKEARLDEKIIEQFAEVDSEAVEMLPEARSVFITGATGFLGAFLLRQLLDSTPARLALYCLVRTKNDASPLDRIRENLGYYGLWDSSFEKRVVALSGDLTRPQLGLTDTQWDHLAASVSMIFHCASLVNYVYPYDAIKPHTVHGTQEILRLAGQNKIKPVLYVSTNGIFPAGQGGVFVENPHIDHYAEHLTTGYAQSKWVAEKLVWKAVEQGLPACVLRPGNIGHHSATGAANPNDFQVMIMNACIRTRLAPQVDNWHFELTPVDYLSQSIVHLASQPEHFHGAFHAISDKRLPTAAVFEHMQTKNLIDDIISMPDWQRALSDQATRKNDPSLQLMSEVLPDLTHYLTDESAYDCRRFESVARSRGLQRPSVDVRYFEKLFAGLHPLQTPSMKPGRMRG